MQPKSIECFATFLVKSHLKAHVVKKSGCPSSWNMLYFEKSMMIWLPAVHSLEKLTMYPLCERGGGGGGAPGRHLWVQTWRLAGGEQQSPRGGRPGGLPPAEWPPVHLPEASQHEATPPPIAAELPQPQWGSVAIGADPSLQTGGQPACRDLQ